MNTSSFSQSRANGERGAIAVLFAFALSALVMAGALAIDVTNVSRSTRDLQGLADVIALDLSRYVDGRTHLEVDFPGGDLQSAWARVKADNGLTATGARTASYTLGNWTNGAFIPSSGLDVPDAVQVRVDEFVRYGLGRVSGKEGQSLSRDAIASRVGRAQFTIGSVGASVNIGNLAEVNGLLGNLVGDTVGLDVLAYDGLASTEISLEDLAVELGFASPEEMAQGTVTAQDLMQASARALGHPGAPPASCSAASSNAATAFFNSSYCSDIASHGNVDLGQIFSITQDTNGGASSTEMNAGSLFGATVHLINGSNFADVPNFDAGVPGLSSTGSVQAIQSPQGTTAFARPGPPCDPDAGSNGNKCRLETQQIDYSSTHTFDVPLALVTVLPPPVVGLPASPLEVTGSFEIRTQAARADATLTKAVCRHPDSIVDDQIDVSVDSIPLTHNIVMNLSIVVQATGTPIAQQIQPFPINEFAPSNVLNFIHDPADPTRNEFTPDGGPKRSGNSLLDLTPQVDATNLAASLLPSVTLPSAAQEAQFLADLKDEIYLRVVERVLLEFDRVANEVLDNVMIHVGGADVWADAMECQNRTPTLVE